MKKDRSTREMKKIQDLISALDSGSQASSSAPTSWVGIPSAEALKPGGLGASRLSMGEGLVTPIEEVGSSAFHAQSRISAVDPVDVTIPPIPNNSAHAKGRSTNPFI